MLKQLIVDLKEDLLSSEQSRRAQALLAIKSSIDSTDTDSLEYIFDFAVSKLKAEDCLKESSQLISDILRVHPDNRHLMTQLVMLYTPQTLPVNCRIAILDIFISCPPPLSQFIPQMEGEKDPRCLLQIFKIVSTAQIDNVELIFEAFSPYFPITFKSNLIRTVSEEELREGLRMVLSSDLEMAHLALPFYNDKLASSQNSIVAVECVKGMMQSYKKAAPLAVSAYYKESINLVVSVLVKDFCDQELAHFIYTFLATSFTDSDIFTEAVLLICEHIKFGITDVKLSMHIPSIIRHVGGVHIDSSRCIYDNIVKSMIEDENCSSNRLYMACVLAFLCAINESKYRISFEGCGLLALANTQMKLLSEQRASKKDMIFSLSFLEAILRDPSYFEDSHSQLQIILSVYNAIEEHHSRLDLSFVSMIAQSVVKHQSNTIISHPDNFTSFCNAVIVESLMAPEDVSVALIDTFINLNMPAQFYLSKCNLEKIDIINRLRWLEYFDKIGNEEGVDLIVCSIQEKQILIDDFHKFTHMAQRIIAISLPVDFSSVELLQVFEEHPDVKAALYSKHNQPISSCTDERSIFCMARAMILRQDSQVFDLIPNLGNLNSLLDDNSCLVNTKHNFVSLPTHQQWFMERTLSDSQYPLECKISWLCCCNETVLRALDLDPFLADCLSQPILCNNTISLLSKLARTDPFIFKNVFTLLFEGLIRTGNNSEKPSIRFAALSLLKDLLDVISGSTVLPFVHDYVRKLRPALGDSKSAIRSLAVKCTDALYAVLL